METQAVRHRFVCPKPGIAGVPPHDEHCGPCYRPGCGRRYDDPCHQRNEAEAQLAAIEAARREPVAWCSDYQGIRWAQPMANRPKHGTPLFLAPPIPPDCVTREKAREMADAARANERECIAKALERLDKEQAAGFVRGMNARVEREVG